MSATDAYLEPLPWETRNLGVEAFAVGAEFFKSPDARLLNERLAEIRHTHGDVFVQARFRCVTTTSRILEASGFYFVEATLSPYAVLSKCAALERFGAAPAGVLPARYRASDIEVAAVTAADRQMAAVRSIAGEAFVDDRFHVDHNCDRERADRRYQLWVDDLFRDRDVRFHALILRKLPIAFMASSAGDLLLAGFARKYASAGLGQYFWLSVLQDLNAAGVQSVSTVISTSNIPILNLYARLGFRFREPRSTFHLWLNR